MRFHRGQNRQCNIRRKTVKKALIIVLIISLSITSLFCETLKHSTLKYEYESYEEDEFPIWSNEIRRAETLFFGSYVFTLPISTLAVSALQGMNVISSTTAAKTAVISLSVATGLSITVATIDWILGRVQN